ncbi:KTSC domain-containing protein [Paraburkholderia eburnea]
MTPVVSRIFAEIGYDPATRQMKVRFRDGRVHIHRRVPAFVYERFIESPRKYAYYQSKVERHYPAGYHEAEDHLED